MIRNHLRHMTRIPETMDFGYPQITAIEAVRLYITLGTAKVSYGVLLTD